MGNRRVWTGRWKGGRTFNGKDGRPVYVLRKMVQGRAYMVHLDARSETEAEALAGRDLRTVSLQELLRELARHPTGRKNRITAIKSFASWLLALKQRAEIALNE